MIIHLLELVNSTRQTRCEVQRQRFYVTRIYDTAIHKSLSHVPPRMPRQGNSVHPRRQLSVHVGDADGTTVVQPRMMLYLGTETITRTYRVVGVGEK